MGYAGKATDTFDASWLIGHLVYSPVYYGDLGQITDLLIDRCDGRVAFVVLSDTPGFFSEYVVVPFGALERTGEHTFQVMIQGQGCTDSAYQSLGTAQGDRFAKYLAMNRNIVGMKSIPATIDPVWADSVYTRLWSNTLLDRREKLASGHRVLQNEWKD